MSAPARLLLALAAIVAASETADAQRTPREDKPLPPYLDPKSPLFELPPDPIYRIPECLSDEMLNHMSHL